MKKRIARLQCVNTGRTIVPTWELSKYLVPRDQSYIPRQLIRMTTFKGFSRISSKSRKLYSNSFRQRRKVSSRYFSSDNSSPGTRAKRGSFSRAENIVCFMKKKTSQFLHAVPTPLSNFCRLNQKTQNAFFSLLLPAHKSCLWDSKTKGRTGLQMPLSEPFVLKRRLRILQIHVTATSGSLKA